MPIHLAPRVVAYLQGSPAPALDAGWLALAQLPRSVATGAVFGDGSHPTTRLCAAGVDVLCRRGGIDSVLDVGTGTGILARIARARGALRVVGTDVDRQALQCARLHADLDLHSTAIHFCALRPDYWGPCFALVVANILEAPLRQLAPTLCAALKPGGRLLISGFTPPQAPALSLLYAQQGLARLGEPRLQGWSLLQFARCCGYAAPPFKTAAP